MTARPDRPYPPDFGSAQTMAYLHDVSVTTWHQWVRAGYVPPGVRIQGSVRWSRHEVAEWLAERTKPRDHASSDPIMEAARGKKAGGRRATA